MAAGKWKLYNTAKEKIGKGLIDFSSHNFRMALFQSTSNCNDLTNEELSDLTNQVANGNGYTLGGVALTGVSWVNSAGTVTFNCNDVQWTGSGTGFSCRFAVIYDDTTVGDPLIAVCVLNNVDVVVPTLNVLDITINISGIFNISGADSD